MAFLRLYNLSLEQRSLKVSRVVLIVLDGEAYKEKQKLMYNNRLEAYIKEAGKLWSVQGPINHYQHGRKYENGQDTGEFLDWDEDRDDIVGYAKDMIDRHYGNIDSRDPQIIQELERVHPVECTAAGKSLGLTPASTTPSSTSNSDSLSFSAAPVLEGDNPEKPKQDASEQDPSDNPPKQDPPDDPPKQDPPRSSSCSNRVSTQGTGAQTNKKGFWDYTREAIGIIASSLASEAVSELGRQVSGASRGPSLSRGPHYNGPELVESGCCNGTLECHLFFGAPFRQLALAAAR